MFGAKRHKQLHRCGKSERKKKRPYDPSREILVLVFGEHKLPGHCIDLSLCQLFELRREEACVFMFVFDQPKFM